MITGIEYRERGLPTYGDRTYNPPNAPQYPNQLAYQYWTRTTSANYTSLFINIIDDFNDATMFAARPIDNVRGYSLLNIETSLLKYIHDLGTLKTKLKENKPFGVTDAQIDELIRFY